MIGQSWMKGRIDALRSFWVTGISARDPVLAKFFGPGPTISGESVSEFTALNVSAVWAAVQSIAGSIASLPLIHYKRLPTGGKTRFTESRLHRVLHDELNPEMSAMVGRETLQGHVLLWGNCYAEIQRNDLGQVVALWPIEPHRVTPRRRSPDGPIEYRVLNESGGTVTIPADRMFHIPGLGFDGIEGHSVVSKARQTIGLAMATERFGSTFFGQGTWFGGALSHPRSLSQTARKNLETSLRERHESAAQAHKFVLLEEGMTWTNTTMPLDDAQFLQTRRFQIVEIARWFNMPPHKLRDLERATFSNIEQQSIEWVVDTLRPWLVRWEQEINRKLIAPLERRQQFAEHLVDALLRGDQATRFGAYAVGRQWGWLSANDVLELENRNPLSAAEGDTYLVPANMMDANRISEPPTPPPAALPVPPQQTEDGAESDDSIVVNAADDRQSTELLTILRSLEAALSRSTQTTQSTEQHLASWREATFQLIAGRLVRRELAQVKKLILNPTRTLERLEGFYARWIEDAVSELRPWLSRMNAADELENQVRVELQAWSGIADEACRHAVGDQAVPDLMRRWTIEREGLLTQRLLEVCHNALANAE
jgi:HK97 family phage portal protein